MQVIHESPILQEVFAERFEQGERKATLELLYRMLNVRFQVSEAYFDQMDLKREDLETLKNLCEIALKASDITAFENALERLDI